VTGSDWEYWESVEMQDFASLQFERLGWLDILVVQDWVDGA